MRFFFSPRSGSRNRLTGFYSVEFNEMRQSWTFLYTQAYKYCTWEALASYHIHEFSGFYGIRLWVRLKAKATYLLFECIYYLMRLLFCAYCLIFPVWRIRSRLLFLVYDVVFL